MDKLGELITDSDKPKLKPLIWSFKDINWRRVVLVSVMYIQFPYGMYLFLFGCNYYTAWWGYLFSLAGGMGLGAGNHRYWSHRSYKANLPYQILIMILSTTAYQDDVIYWCRNHRIHHKFTETDADPHDARRGFFFSHVGWLLLKDRPEVLEKEKEIEMTDLTEDPVLKFQLKYFYPLTLLLAVFIPTFIPTLWGESWWIAFNICVIFRYTLQIQVSTSVNSIAHLYGNQPYDKRQYARESKLASFLTAGEGWHNYHHTFPYDYRASEFGCSQQWNLSKLFIDFFAWIGWVYDRKTASPEIIMKRRIRTGSISDIKLRETEKTFL